MPDPADQLQRLYEAGFTLETLERFPRHAGAVRDGCIALLEVLPNGLSLTGTPGWRMGEVMGVLIERDGHQVFQSKSESVAASPEMLQALRRFQAELEQVLMDRA
jgi:hypothetical protein